jgi:hypothetical protein
MKTRSPLTDQEKEKAKLLHASGKTIFAVARVLGRSPHTLKKFLRKPEILRQVGIQREELAAMFDDITQRTLSGVTETDIEKASLLQKLTSAGISVDKAAILRGQATSTVDVHVLLHIASMIRGDQNRALNPQQPHHNPALPEGHQ